MDRFLGKHVLLPHPDTNAPDLKVGCKLSAPGANAIKFEFVVVGAVDRILLPAPADQARTDGLWQNTCFEAFIGLPDGGYLELNFSPSGQWASYRFSAYRQGMEQALDVTVGGIACERSDMRLSLSAEAAIPLQSDFAQHRLGLSAVIEDLGTNKSYWALAHPAGKPDFHHAACFAGRLAPPDNA